MAINNIESLTNFS